MSPEPNQIDEERHVAAALVAKKSKTEITVEREHDQRRGQHWKSGDDKKIGGERGPAEHGHAHVAHSRRANLEDRRDEIDAGHERADAGDQDRPNVIVDAYSRRKGKLGERRIDQPTRL